MSINKNKGSNYVRLVCIINLTSINYELVKSYLVDC